MLFFAQGKFMTLDQTFIDQNFQHGLSKLESCLLSSQLEELCDCRGPADLSAYKLNTEKLYVWLGQKVASFFLPFLCVISVILLFQGCQKLI